MFIQNIAKKNTQTENKILYSHTDNKIFVKMLRKIFNAERVGIIDESAFANKGIDLINSTYTLLHILSSLLSDIAGNATIRPIKIDKKAAIIDKSIVA